jgi:hypothetical protein
MKIEPSLRVGMAAWRRCFREIQSLVIYGGKSRNFWEGADAYEELRRCGFLALYSPLCLTTQAPHVALKRVNTTRTTPSHRNRLLRWIVRSLQFHRERNAGKWQRRRVHLKSFAAFCAEARLRFEDVADKLRLTAPRLSRRLERSAGALQIGGSPEKFLAELRASDWAASESYLAKVNGYGKLPAPEQERERQSRLVLELASIIRMFDMDHELTERTVARLVVLSMYCSGEAQLRGEELYHVSTSHRRLTVSGVYQILQRANRTQRSRKKTTR